MKHRLRVIVGAIGLAGHTLPAIALARELRSRGHEVLFHGFERWRETIEDLDLGFAGDHDQIVSRSITGPEPDLAQTARALAASIAEFRADVVVGDALTLSPLLAAEVAGLPRVRLFPEVYPIQASGAPVFSLGLVVPRTALGAAAWRSAAPLLATRMPSTGWLRSSHSALNRQRRELGLREEAEINRPDPDELTIVATLPALEYPRTWPARVHVTGPLFFDLPSPELELPDSAKPLVLVAPSTVKDPERRLIRITLEALAQEPVSVLVTTGGLELASAGAIPANAVVVDWVDYSEVMKQASLVVCHGNHGTIAQSLASGIPVVVSPAMPDDAEHGARVTWAGAGSMVPQRLLGPRSMRATARQVLGQDRFRQRASEIAAWSRANDGAANGADMIESYVLSETPDSSAELR